MQTLQRRQKCRSPVLWALRCREDKALARRLQRSKNAPPGKHGRLESLRQGCGTRPQGKKLESW